MNNDIPEDTTIQTADNLITQMQELSESVTRLDIISKVSAFTKRTRRMVYLLFISLAIDLCLSIGLGYVAIQASHNSNAVKVHCLAANEAKSTDNKLWNYILNLTYANSVKLTPDQAALRQKQVTQFRGYIAVAFKPQPC